MLPRLSILVRLLLLLAVPLAALMIVGLSGLASINATGATTAELQTRLQLQAQLEELRDATNAATQSGNAWLNSQTDTKTSLETLSAARSRFEKATDAYIQALPANERQSAEQALKPTLAAVGAALGRLQDSMLDNNAAAARVVMMTDLSSAAATANERIATIQSADRERTQRIINATQARGSSFFTLNAVLGFSGLALALLFGFYIGRSITAPVQKLTDTVRAVAAGNIDARAKVGGYDEIGVLGDALDKL